MKKIVAGNWKMNMNYHEACKLMDEIIVERSSIPNDVSLLIAPPSIYLSEFASTLRDLPSIFLAAQNCYHETNGAFTGEVSAEMLSSLGISHCIVGHSERRSLMGECDEMVNKKVLRLIENGINPIVCVGEVLEERENNTFTEVVKNQVRKAVAGISKSQSGMLIWAYEPVWAIGTGKTASSEQAQEMHAIIRKELNDLGMNADVSILYGGSCKPNNANEIFACNDVNGGLIGGASLKAKDFLAIANSY